MDARPTVLVVDDDGDVLDVLDDVLSEAGYRVRRAMDGEAALALLDSSVAAAVIDLRMPRLDGWGMLTHLARQGRRVPVIVLSGLPLWPEAHVQLSALGVVAVLEKPLDRMETLLDSLFRAVRRAPMRGRRLTAIRPELA